MKLYINDWIDKEHFIIFGAGIMGAEFCNSLQKYDIILGFIDNDAEKQKSPYMSYPVFSFEKYLKEYREYKIILACSNKNKETIENQMINAGLKANLDFLYIRDFKLSILPYYKLKYTNKLCMHTVQICLTERCTLKCKKCAHGCYNVPNNSPDLSLNEVQKSTDIFFPKIDYINQFHLIGGEPFLYKDLKKTIIYVGDRYRDKIQNFIITTNGSIMPSKDILNIIKKYNVMIWISNYSYTLPYLQIKYDKLLKILEKNKIDYEFKKEELTWTDYGFDHVDRGFFKNNINKQEKTEELKEVFSACKTPCREVRGNKLYFCIQARTCNDNLHFNVGKDDYLDLDKLGNDYESKKLILDLEMGNIPKGYLDMCNYCNGNDRFKFPIHAAEQI